MELLSEMGIEHTLIRTKRKTLAIVIERGGNVSVRVPKRVSQNIIDAFVQEKRGWIERAVEKQRELKIHPIPKQYSQGEDFLFLGKKYPLHIKENLTHQFLFQEGFYLDSKAQKDARNLFIDWYKQRALEILYERAALHAEQMRVQFKDIRIGSAKYQYGSCNSKGNLRFSWKLILAPMAVIDYVVVHELSHLQQMNHSQRFWKCVETHYPYYRDSKKWLKQHSHLLSLN